MKMKKITACAMCMAAATGMMLGSTAMAADYNGHWAEKQIQEFIDNGYLVGYPDGSFKPSNTITRAEIATVVNQMMGYTEKADISNYTDLNKDSWYYKQIETIVKSKVMVGLNDTQWDPNGDVTREQVCVMVCELNNIAVESTDKNDELRAQLKAKGYTDVDNISSWAVPYVAATVEKGYMVGYADDMTLRTKNPITRAEAVTLLKECVPEQDQSVYVMMNIPYDEFYASDVRNDTKVDVFSSATKNKTRTGTLAGGSYHVNSDGSQIDGISFPVKIDKSALADKKQVTDDDSYEITVTNRGQTKTTTYTGVDALFENETYAYYALSETPEYYKEATVNEDGSISFGKIQGTAQKVDGTTANLRTFSNYGDYELLIEGFDEIDTSTDKIYGVIVSTDENDYGLRHLENIWRVTDLAWCTGFTDAVHNCPTDSEHYKSMMGQTIQKVTYYTSKGIYEIPMEVYVPVKFEGSVAVESAMVSDGETTVTLPELPKDYEVEYSVKGLDGAKVENGKLTYSTDAKNGSYTLTVSDKSGKYADLTATFELKVDAPAKAADDNMSVVKNDETVTDAAFGDYIGEITSVSVNGTSYSPKGGHGGQGVVVVNKDGSITIPENAKVQDGKYKVVISATGYTDVTVEVPEEAGPMTAEQKTQLTDLMTQAKALLDNEYAVKDSDAYADLSAHYTEAEAVTTMGQAADLIAELPAKIAAVQDEVTKNTPVVKTGTTTVNPDADREFTAYDLSVDVYIQNNVITDIKLNETQNPIASDNKTYVEWALNGRTKGDTTYKGVVEQYVGQDYRNYVNVDTVSGATCSSKAIKTAVTNALW